MSNASATSQRGALAGLALLLAYAAAADDSLRDSVREQLRDENYVLVEDRTGARLYVFSEDDGVYDTRWIPPASGSAAAALANVHSADAGDRVRALTELSGEDGTDALHAALVLLSDPDEAVREEAVQLILEHPQADKSSVIAMARQDPSERVREAVEDLLDDEAEED